MAMGQSEPNGRREGTQAMPVAKVTAPLELGDRTLGGQATLQVPTRRVSVTQCKVLELETSRTPT
jgi:hypothetical protein